MLNHLIYKLTQNLVVFAVHSATLFIWQVHLGKIILWFILTYTIISVQPLSKFSLMIVCWTNGQRPCT